MTRVLYENRSLELDPGILFDAATLDEVTEEVNANNTWHPLTNWKFGCVLVTMMSECRGGWKDGGALSEDLRHMFSYHTESRDAEFTTASVGGVKGVLHSHIDALPGFRWVNRSNTVGVFHSAPPGVWGDWRGGRAAITDCVARRLQLVYGRPEALPAYRLSVYYQWLHDDGGQGRASLLRLVREVRQATLGDAHPSLIGEYRDDVMPAASRFLSDSFVPVTAAFPVGIVESRRPLLFEVMTTYFPNFQSRWQYAASTSYTPRWTYPPGNNPSFRYAYFCPDRPSAEFAAKFDTPEFEDFRTLLKSPALDDPHRAALVDWLLERGFDEVTATNFGVPGYARLFNTYGLHAMCGGDL